MHKGVLFLLFGAATFLFNACSPTKMVPDGDALYTGAKVSIEDPVLSGKKKRQLSKDLATITKPKPNKRILGIPFGLLFNNSRLFRRKLGEPPVLLSSVNLDYNKELLTNNLENQGYF